MLEKTYPNAIQNVASDNNSKNLLAFTDGRTVEVYSTKKRDFKKHLTNFKTLVSALAYRGDARLLATGE